MRINPPGYAEFGYARAFIGTRIARLGEARKRGDRGASAIELAIITAILVGLAVTVLLIIFHIVNQRANQIRSNNGQIP
jgi:multisubunit Na+/H+ antiporter MnhC subunit